MHIRNFNIKIALSTVLIAILMSACQNTKQKEKDASNEEKVLVDKTVAGKEYTGDFVFTPEAAVFTGKSFIYGVEINDLAIELADRIKAVQNDKHDIVTVTILGEVSSKLEGQDGWDEIITITHIIDVSDTPTRPDVQF